MLLTSRLHSSVFAHQIGPFHPWLPALIGAIGSIAAGGLSAAAQSRQNRQNIESGRDMMDYQWSRYGSPAAQLAAYKAAGINPFAQGNIQASQPQSQIPDQQSPASAGFGMLGSLIAPLQQLATSAMNYRLQQANVEGVELDNSLKKFDLGEIKPETLKQIRAQIASTEAGTKLTNQQLKLVAKQILKAQLESQGLSFDNYQKMLDIEWKKVQLENDMPRSEAEFLKMQSQKIAKELDKLDSDIANTKASTRAIEQTTNIRQTDEQRAQWQQDVIKNLNEFRDQIDKFDFEKEFSVVPEPLRKLAAPMIRAVFYMLLNQMSQGITDPLGTVGDVMRFIPK